MILCEFTPDGGTLNRISLKNRALDHQWFSYIKSLSSFKIETSEQYGGYAKPSFSDFELWPEMFKNWPPPDSADVKVIYSDSDENGGTIIFDGVALLDSYDRIGVQYNFAMPEFDSTVTSGALQSGTLSALFTSYCSTLGLTLDATNGRTVSPDVIYTPSSDVQLIDMMDEMAAWFCHGFKIVEGTLYLYDMLTATTATALTEFDVLPCSYRKSKPISLFTCSDQSATGPVPSGKEEKISTAYHTTAANIISALSDISTMIGKSIAEIPCMIDDSKPKVLDDLTLYDESTPLAITTAARAFSVVYNFDDNQMQIDAVGALS